MPRLRTFNSLIAHRDFRFMWVANFCGNTATWLQLLTVGWLVHDLTSGSSSSALQVITVGGLTTLPVLVVGPWAGVLGDRVDRRKMVMVTQSLMVAVAATFAFLVASGQIQESWHVYVYALIGGAFRSITMPMQQVLVANTVPREDLPNAYATNVLTIPGTRMIGPFVGGILIFSLGFAWNFAIEAVLYAAVVLLLLPMRTPYRQQGSRGQSSPLSDLMEGIRYVWKGERVIFYLMVLSLVPNVLLHPLWFLLPTFTADVLNRDADFGGYLLAATGFGGLMCALVVASFGFGFKKGKICLVTVAASSIFTILFAQSQWIVLSFIAIAMMAFSQSYFRTTDGALIQLLSPDRLRGRITTLQGYGQGFLPFSSVLIGLFAWQTSPSFAATVVGLVGLALAVLFFFTFSKVRELE